jgi:hypothetical protein
LLCIVVHMIMWNPTVLLFLFLWNSPNVYTLVWKHTNKWRNICTFQIFKIWKREILYVICTTMHKNIENGYIPTPNTFVCKQYGWPSNFRLWIWRWRPIIDADHHSTIFATIKSTIDAVKFSNTISDLHSNQN